MTPTVVFSLGVIWGAIVCSVTVGLAELGVRKLAVLAVVAVLAAVGGVLGGWAIPAVAA